MDFLGRFANADRLEVLQSVSIPVQTLDATELPRLDFIKLDVQGAELNVLQGGRQILKDVVGIQCEVEFVQIYHDQPLFGDVTRFLAESGLEFVDFTHLSREPREHGELNFGHMTFGDALYLRSPESMANAPIAQLRRYAAVLLIYERYDSLNYLAGACETAQPGVAEQLKMVVGLSRSAWRKRRRLFSAMNFIASLLGREWRAFPIH
jgi:hypothetical protein